MDDIPAHQRERAPIIDFLLRFVTPTLVVFGLVVSLIEISISMMAGNSDAIDDRRSIQAAQAALAALQGQMEAITRDNAYWDDAAIEVRDNNVGWLDTTWGASTADGGFYDAVMVLDRQKAVHYASRNSRSISILPKGGLSRDIRLLIDELDRSGSKDHAARSGFVATAGGIYLVGVADIAPISADIEIPEDGQRTLLLAHGLDAGRIQALSDTYLIPQLRITSLEDEAGSHLDILSPGGAPIARLSWSSMQPGETSRASVFPVVVAALIVIGLAFLLLLWLHWRSVSRLRRREAASRHAALHDALTGLNNRLGLRGQLETALRLSTIERTEVALLCLDLDGFKEINDTYGHSTGDELIRRVAAELSKLAREHGLLARVGGDEFAIVLLGDRRPWIEDVLVPSILRLFGNPFVIGDRICVVGASLGLAVSSSGAMDAEEILRRVDLAMYRAKDAGGSRLSVYEEHVDEERIARQDMERDLRRAVAEGTLEVAFQPIVDAATTAICGVEALARWKRPGHGYVPPDIFIVVAESSGLIDALGLLIIRLVCQQAQTSADLQLSINVSPSQFRNPDFPARVGEILRECGIDPARITLEITEGYLIRHADRVVRAIKELKALGLKVALDDFGTGFASIGYLRQFEFDRLKIDRSLVVALDHDAKATEMLQAIMALAAALNLPVTAEGIERKEQANVLRLAGCDHLQGYYFGKPMPFGDIEILLGKERLTRSATG